jgi:hypothetical protein
MKQEYSALVTGERVRPPNKSRAHKQLPMRLPKFRVCLTHSIHFRVAWAQGDEK